jgi:hypothetical protein
MRVLVVGGHADMVAQNLMHRFKKLGLEFADHWSGRSSRIPDDAPKGIDGILMFKDALSHSHMHKVQGIAHDRGLPFAAVSSKMSLALPVLRMYGFIPPLADGEKESEGISEDEGVSLMRSYVETEITVHDRTPSVAEITHVFRSTLGMDKDAPVPLERLQRARNEAVRDAAATKPHTEVSAPAEIPVALTTDPCDWVALVVGEAPHLSIEDTLDRLNTLLPENTMLDTREAILTEKTRHLEALFNENPGWGKLSNARRTLLLIEEGREFYTKMPAMEREALRALVRDGTSLLASKIADKIRTKFPSMPYQIVTLLVLSGENGKTAKRQIYAAYKAITQKQLGTYYGDMVATALGFRYSDSVAPEVEVAPPRKTPAILMPVARPEDEEVIRSGPAVATAPPATNPDPTMPFDIKALEARLSDVILDLIPSTVRQEITASKLHESVTQLRKDMVDMWGNSGGRLDKHEKLIADTARDLRGALEAMNKLTDVNHKLTDENRKIADENRKIMSIVTAQQAVIKKLEETVSTSTGTGSSDGLLATILRNGGTLTINPPTGK